MPKQRRVAVGIEGIAVYVPRHYLDLTSLASARAVDAAKYTRGLGARRMAVTASDEDPVVLAASAVRTLLERHDVAPADVGLAIVGTESGVDAAKPIASYVHRLSGLPADCRTFDTQHACYSATAGLRMACAWVLSGLGGPRRALVVATDVAKYDVGSPGEPTQGAAAVAMLVGRHPVVLDLDLLPEAVHSREVMDFWRPPHRRTALADGHHSIRCYLEALEGCVERYRSRGGGDLGELDYLLYHVPFPKMAWKAHEHLLGLIGGGGGRDEAAAVSDYERRVLPALWANVEVGNAYSASLYLALAGLLEHPELDVAGARVGLFSYGSGSCAELMVGRIGPDRAAWRGRTGLGELLARRLEVDHDRYLRMRSECEALELDGAFRVPDASTGLAFCGTTSHRRIYRDVDGALLLPR